MKDNTSREPQKNYSICSNMAEEESKRVLIFDNISQSCDKMVYPDFILNFVETGAVWC